MTIWYTSDTHFGHENIIRYCDRPFADAREMDEVLIERWNEVVKPSDHVWHLGDVTMKRGSQDRKWFYDIIHRLNGHKRLIMGNHDHFHVSVYSQVFEKVMAMHRHDDLWLMHVPCHPDNVGSSMAIIHGHIHQNPSPKPIIVVDHKGFGDRPRVVPYINVSVEATNYRPISLEEVKERVSKAIEAQNL